MGVGQTGRIIERADFRTALNTAVETYERRKEYKRRKNFKTVFHNMINLAICSQCKRKMRKDIANAQIENKRENAPICIACILGKPRKAIPAKSEYSKMDPSTKEKYKNFIKSAKNKQHHE
jgi:hypothetical protein